VKTLYSCGFRKYFNTQHNYTKLDMGNANSSKQARPCPVDGI